MAPISILVVDDSVVVRRLMRDVLDADPGIEVVGTAANGRIALAKIPQLNPDLIVLDLEMPVMDGLETLRHLRTDHRHIPVIMFSTETERGAAATLDGLELGARDYVTKPSGLGSVQASMERVRDALVPKIVSLCGGLSRESSRADQLPQLVRTRRGRQPHEVVVIGVSTGGPEALTTVLPALPADLPVPVLVVQHMPKTFTRLLAERLDLRCALSVSEAHEGDAVVPGRVLLAPGDRHLRLRKVAGKVTVALDDGTPENFCRPAVDALFRSAAETYGAGCLGVVLTGMGSDGTRGARAIVEAGGRVVVQDERSSVVWGMPGSVAAAGLASERLPVSMVAAALRHHVASSYGLPVAT